VIGAEAWRGHCEIYDADANVTTLGVLHSKLGHKFYDLREEE
jgi:hypothetical protein